MIDKCLQLLGMLNVQTDKTSSVFFFSETSTCRCDLNLLLQTPLHAFEKRYAENTEVHGVDKYFSANTECVVLLLISQRIIMLWKDGLLYIITPSLESSSPNSLRFLNQTILISCITLLLVLACSTEEAVVAVSDSTSTTSPA